MYRECGALDWSVVVVVVLASFVDDISLTCHAQGKKAELQAAVKEAQREKKGVWSLAEEDYVSVRDYKRKLKAAAAE